MGSILDYSSEMARLIPSRNPPVNRGPVRRRRAKSRLRAGWAVSAVLAGFLGLWPAASPRAQQEERDAEPVYRAVVGSVHLVAAVSSLEDIKNKRNINQGSAVAISDRELITNCHVVKDKALVYLLRNGQARPATVGPGDVEKDLCTLTISGGGLTP